MTSFAIEHLATILLVVAAFLLGIAVALVNKNNLRATLAWITDEVMNKDGVNSRLVFFLHGVSTAIGILLVTIGFLFAKEKSGEYTLMISALGGGGVGAAIGRFFTKKGDGPNQPQ